MALVALISGCSTQKSLVIQKRHARYGIGELPQGWIRKPFHGAEIYLEHKSKNAAIFINSQCEKLSDGPLEALTSQLLVGIGAYEIITQAPLIIEGREALVSQINVTIDGVKRYLKVMVLRKNQCVFDAVFNAPLGNGLVGDFDAIIQTFWTKAGQ